MSEQVITLTKIYELLQELTARFDRSDKRVERMDTVQGAIALRLLSVETILNHHSTLLQSLRLRVDSLHGLVEELERRTGRIDQEYVMITEALRRLEKRFDQVDALRLNERIAAVEARLLALETPRA